MDETKDSNCTLADKLQRLIQNNKLEKLYSETLQKNCVASDGRTLINFKQIKNINFEIENFEEEDIC